MEAGVAIVLDALEAEISTRKDYHKNEKEEVKAAV